MKSEEIFDLMKNTPNEAAKELIQKALAFADNAHKNQTRFSGEPYIIHPFAVAKILAEMGADSETITAGLLHDTIEDNPEITLEDLEREFGPTIAFMVDGVTKLGKLKYKGAERHAESLRKLFVAMAKDIRVIMIRLADRLHNISTLSHVPPEKQKRIAIETLDIYAPLANRLGMWKVKGMLEDGAFPFAYPEAYKEVVSLRKQKGKENIKRLEKIYRTLARHAAENGLENLTVDYRIKYLYSLYKKLQRKNMDIDQIYDISALRVVVPVVADCYKILGLIHDLWIPVPGRLKDYIASPKPNGYQSIHTTVFTGDGNVAEIQILTKKMHLESEFGIASHLWYDEQGKPKSGTKVDQKTAWIKDLLAWHKQEQDPEKFIEHLKQNFFKDRIFVFTPKGDVIELPKGATTIDFAYAVHSDIGEHLAGARVNGKLVSLETELENEDIVEIEVKKTSKPTAKWLLYAKTSMARKHIKNFLSNYFPSGK